MVVDLEIICTDGRILQMQFGMQIGPSFSSKKTLDPRWIFQVWHEQVHYRGEKSEAPLHHSSRDTARNRRRRLDELRERSNLF